MFTNFLTISRVKQTREFPYVFPSHAPILLGRISGVCINHVLLFLLTVMYFTQMPDACHNGQIAVVCAGSG